MPIDGTLIQQKVYRGYAIAAAKTGVAHDLYRPSTDTAPLDLINQIGTLPVALDARPSYKFAIPALHTDAERYALVDGAAVLPGDYLVGPRETVFIAAMPMLQPIVCIACNAVISLRRLSPARGFGAIEDRSDAGTQESELFSRWPASMLYSGRGRGSTDGVPGDQPDPDFMVLLPPVPGAVLPHSGDVLVDDNGQRFAVGWFEASQAGWRMLARLLTTG